MLVVRVVFRDGHHGGVIVVLGFAIVVLLKVEVGQRDGGERFLVVVLRGGSHGFCQIVYAKILVFIDAGDFREGVIDLVTVVFVLLVIQHLVELFGDGVAVGFGAIVVGGKVHLGAECHLIIVGFFDDGFEVLLGLRLLSEVFVKFAENKLETSAEFFFRFVVQGIADIVDGFLHIAVGGGEMVFGFGSVEDHSEFLLVLLFVHVADGFQQLVGTGIISLAYLGAGKQHLCLIADV